MTHEWAKEVFAGVRDARRQRTTLHLPDSGVVVVSPSAMFLIRAYVEQVVHLGDGDSLFIDSLPVVADTDQAEGWRIVWDADVEAMIGA